MVVELPALHTEHGFGNQKVLLGRNRQEKIWKRSTGASCPRGETKICSRIINYLIKLAH